MLLEPTLELETTDEEVAATLLDALEVEAADDEDRMLDEAVPHLPNPF
jgi:hypothetical protein